MSESFYTSIDEVLGELMFRGEKTTLLHQVDDWIGEDIPCHLEEKPCAILFRHIATPDKEMERFVKGAEHLGLTPLVLEFTEDRFVNRNRDKAKLGKLCFSQPAKHEGEYQYEYHKIIDFATAEKKALKDIVTLDGEKLVDYHHRWLAKVYPNVVHCDVSEWILRQGQRAKEFYKAFFCLFIAHGILFDTFLEDNDEGPFTKEVVRPAFDEAVAHFNKKPLIVEILTEEEWQHKIWWTYPIEVKMTK